MASVTVVTHVSKVKSRAYYLVVIAGGGLPVGGPQGLELGIQDVQELLHELDRHADIAGVDQPTREVDQLAGDVGCVLSALDLFGGSVFIMSNILAFTGEALAGWLQGVQECVCVYVCVTNLLCNLADPGRGTVGKVGSSGAPAHRRLHALIGGYTCRENSCFFKDS